jgi:hypothetical protein
VWSALASVGGSGVDESSDSQPAIEHAAQRTAAKAIGVCRKRMGLRSILRR